MIGFLREVGLARSRASSHSDSTVVSATSIFLPDGSHVFVQKRFGAPTACRLCTKFIWGIGSQGFECKDCGYTVHHGCKKLVPNTCRRAARWAKQSIARPGFDSMDDLVSALKAGLPLQSRKKLLTTYADTFTGKECVDWFMTNLPVHSRRQASELGARLVRAGYIRHAVDPRKPFKDSATKLYVFAFLPRLTSASPPPSEHRHSSPSALSASDTGVALESCSSYGSEQGSSSLYSSVSSVPRPALEDYEMLNSLGHGGFGRVLKVREKRSGNVYAMKVISKSRISEQKHFQALYNEKKILLNDSPFLVHLHSTFHTDSKLYFVMDYICGGNLGQLLAKRGPFPERDVRFMAAEIVLAVEHLHQCGILYRDLKLENILLDEEGHLCLIDFGLAKEMQSSLDTTSTMCGTPTYMAPEVLAGRPYGMAVDWWALGVCIYELLCGVNPFDGRDRHAIMQNVLSGLVALPEEVSPAAQDIILRLLDRNPKTRICCALDGTRELEQHAFFQGIDWEKLLVKDVRPPYAFEPEKDVDFPLPLKESQPIATGDGPDSSEQFKDFNYVSRRLIFDEQPP